jgi:phosphatidylglycerol:prolipoprotein diacylglycerol transferase
VLGCHPEGVHPELGDLVGVELPVPTHEAFVALGVLAALAVFCLEARRRGHTDERLAFVVAGALVGGGMMMRLGTWWQHVELQANASLAEQWAHGNRSILGGLFGAWLGVHVAKRLSGYRARTGDLFAPAVALGMAVGRVGCLLTELPGTPTGTSFGISLATPAAARVGAEAGVPLHPSFAYEIAFHTIAFLLLWFWLRHRLTAPGETLTLYVAGYGAFRFLVEFVRGNEAVWLGLSRPQVVLLFTVPLVLARLVVLARAGRLRLAPAPGAAPRTAGLVEGRVPA